MLKKTIIIFLFLLSAFSFFATYSHTNREELDEIVNIEEKIAGKFFLPNDSAISDPQGIYPILERVSKELNVNILRKSISFNANGEKEYHKYVLLNQPSNLLKNINIDTKVESDDLYKKIKGEVYLSTNLESKNEMQLGLITEFGSNDYVDIRSLENSYCYMPVYGVYYVETIEKELYIQFIEAFTKEINAYLKELGGSYSSSDFTWVNESQNEEGFEVDNIINNLQLYFYGLVLLLIIYYVVGESKKIGIMKLQGIDSVRTWYYVIGKLVLSVMLIVGGVQGILLFLIPNINKTFVYNVIGNYIQTFIGVLLLSLLPLIMIKMVNVSDFLKNRRKDLVILIINTIFRIMCSIGLIFACLVLVNQYTDIKEKQDALKDWVGVKEYGVIYPLKIGNDQENIEGFQNSLDLELYSILNNAGGILANSSMYEEEYLNMNKDYKGVRTVKVNKNYLEEFPIYDDEGETVQISEDVKEWVILLPVKYKNKYKELIDYFTETRKRLTSQQNTQFEDVVSKRESKQEIKIIWVKDNQEFFSFNPEVYKRDNNIILDPIVEVVTEANRLIYDSSCVNGNALRAPMKIKLIDNDSKKTYEALVEELKRVGLQDNIKYIISVEQYMLEEIDELYDDINKVVILSGALYGLLVILVGQNIVIFFDKNEEKFVVRRLFGIGRWKTYKEYVGMFCLVWGIQTILCLAINSFKINGIIYIIGLLGAIELITSVLAFNTIEVRKTKKIVNGG